MDLEIIEKVEPELNKYLKNPYVEYQQRMNKTQQPTQQHNFGSTKPVTYDDILKMMSAKYLGNEVKVVKDPIQKDVNRYFSPEIVEETLTREEYLKKVEEENKRVQQINKAKSKQLFMSPIGVSKPTNLRSMGQIFRTNRI